MLQRIPEDMYKRFTLKTKQRKHDLEVTGFKSSRPSHVKIDELSSIADYSKIDPEGSHVSIEQGEFRLHIGGVDNLTKLKEAVEFALEENESKD